VHETGVREVIGLDVGEVESGAFWTEFLRGLRKRGLAGVQLVISDDHEGLKAAIARVPSCPWQRCTVHYADLPVMPTSEEKSPQIAVLAV
jgi:transposase-like protein